MFTGIIQEVGKVRSAAKSGGNLNLEIAAPKSAGRLSIGDSISINGACLTVTVNGPDHFRVEAVTETVSHTNLGQLRTGDPVNLELPLGLSDLLHGHLVQGHVDCTSRIQDIRRLEGSRLFTFSYPAEYRQLIIDKGSVAVDGVSLTVIAVAASNFQVSMIPHTMENTIFKHRRLGDQVNLEFDMVAKYIKQIVSPHEMKITQEFLKEHGF